jgi:hypothetical protein
MGRYRWTNRAAVGMGGIRYEGWATVKIFPARSTIIAILFLAVSMGVAAYIGSNFRRLDTDAVQKSRQNLTEIVALVRTIESRQAAAIKEIEEIKARQCLKQ